MLRNLLADVVVIIDLLALIVLFSVEPAKSIPIALGAVGITIITILIEWERLFK